MSVRLRLRRMGKTHRPFYRICAIERGRARDAKYIESIGYYDPFIEDDAKKFHLDKERAEYWLSVGATASQTVMKFLRKAEVSGLVPAKKSKSQKKSGNPPVAPWRTPGEDHKRNRNRPWIGVFFRC